MVDQYFKERALMQEGSLSHGFCGVEFDYAVGLSVIDVRLNMEVVDEGVFAYYKRLLFVVECSAVLTDTCTQPCVFLAVVAKFAFNRRFCLDLWYKSFNFAQKSIISEYGA